MIASIVYLLLLLLMKRSFVVMEVYIWFRPVWEKLTFHKQYTLIIHKLKINLVLLCIAEITSFTPSIAKSSRKRTSRHNFFPIPSIIEAWFLWHDKRKRNGRWEMCYYETLDLLDKNTFERLVSRLYLFVSNYYLI
jgi:hypothetical protein